MTASLYQSGSAFSPCDWVMRLTLGAQMAHGKLSMSQSLANKTPRPRKRATRDHFHYEVTANRRSLRTISPRPPIGTLYLESVGRIPSHRLRHPNGRPASDPFLLSNFCLRRLNLIFACSGKQKNKRAAKENGRRDASPLLRNSNRARQPIWS